MYSEEELKNAIEISVAKALGVMSFTINEESFEQFKKKQHIKWLTDEKNLYIFLVVT